jgi:uncharacterized protein
MEAKGGKMTHTPHELQEFFPQKVDRIQHLKSTDPHFAKLSDEYHDINRAVHRAETDVEPTDDFNLATMRKQRLALLDAISAYLRQGPPE